MTRGKPTVWFHQRHGYEVGNFIMASAALRLLAAKLGHPIKVVFDTSHVEDMYQDCDFIETVKGSFPRSRAINHGVNMPVRGDHSDYAGWLINLGVTGELQPYVDPCKPAIHYLRRQKSQHPVAIIHGCMPGSVWWEKKDLGLKIRMRILRLCGDAGLDPVVIGSVKDFDAFWTSHMNPPGANYHIAQTTRQAISAIRGCKGFIANDTGMMHASAALGLPGIAIWKETSLTKNRPPSTLVEHINAYDDLDIAIRQLANQIVKIK